MRENEKSGYIASYIAGWMSKTGFSRQGPKGSTWIPPMVVEDAIKDHIALQGSTPGEFIHATRVVTLVVNSSGDVVTVIPK